MHVIKLVWDEFTFVRICNAITIYEEEADQGTFVLTQEQRRIQLLHSLATFPVHMLG